MRFIEAHIEVSDLEKSLELYSKLISHVEIKHWSDGSAAALVLEDGFAFGLWIKGKLGIHNGRGGAHVHFALEIKDSEYEYYLNRIKELGLTPFEHVWPSGYRSVYFFDYDGNQGEFITANWLELNKPLTVSGA